ncbi:flagellar export chaperone FliS [Rheinheimera maricola]|uniref:Flagellar secretion chaperone FliS n=1 Tax=Rheinheimera maricola TaxID=2793282 RepID=A0ABS7X3S2_9GAMM|nr:flagellar export chaperone FliS [Rheinheimera maricola]MBZ9610210.1 flagellar export chaperone FliS [Rheinheimera maricola]
MSNAKLNFYQKGATKTQLADASPYVVIKMLMVGVMDNLALAKGAVQRKDLETKAKTVSKASAIIESLRSCLDESQAPELGQNLFALYSYMIDRLIDASLEKDTTAAIDEVADLFRQIKSAWDEIPFSAQQQAEAQRTVVHANVG